MNRQNQEWSIKCPTCGNIRYFSKHSSYYESKRLNRLLCKSCSMKQAWDIRGRKSQYDEFIKRGDIFGFLTVISERVGKNNVVTCICKCGNTIGCRASYLLDGRSKACRECRTGTMSSNWKGVGQVPSMFLIKLKNQAKERNIPVSVTLEYLSHLYEKQNGKCALSGLPLEFEWRCNGITHKRTASLDRIDSLKGYIEGNVQWTHSHINVMKNTHSFEYFIKLCREVVNYYDKN